jgi:hypothetical protein
MSLLKFTFKNEAIWMLIASIAIPLIGVLIALIAWLIR